MRVAAFCAVMLLVCSMAFADVGGEGATCVPNLPGWEICEKSVPSWAAIVTNNATIPAGVHNTPFLANAANTRYVLQGDISANSTAIIVGASNVIIDLNGYTITYNDESPGAGVTLSNDYGRTKVAVINGSIIQGSDKCEGDAYGVGCNPISSTMTHRTYPLNYQYTISDIHISNIYAKASGRDISLIATRGVNAVVEQCYVDDDYEFGTLKDRHTGINAIGVNDAAIVRNSTVMNSRHRGISTGAGAQVYGNYVKTRSLAVNAPGLTGFGRFWGNTVNATGSHAIGAWFRIEQDGVATEVWDNLIYARTTAIDDEYSSGYLASPNSTITGNYAAGIRTTKGGRDLYVHDNEIHVYSNGNYTGTYSPTGDVAYINTGSRGLFAGTNFPLDAYANTCTHTDNDNFALFSNNTIYAIDDNEDSSAYGISVETGFSDELMFANNHVYASVYHVALGGVYGPSWNMPLFIRNTFERVGSDSRYKSITSGFGGYYAQTGRFVDNVYTGGASESLIDVFDDMKCRDASFVVTGNSTDSPDILFGYDDNGTYRYTKRIYRPEDTAIETVEYETPIVLEYATLADFFEYWNDGDISYPSDPDPTCDIDNLNLCDQSGCEALGKYWYDGVCNAEAEPVDPEEPTAPTASGPILRTGTHLLRVGDSVLRVQ